MNKTHTKAAELAGAPIEALFMASRVNPLLSFALSGLIALSVVSGTPAVQIFALVPFFMVIWLTVGRWVAVTADEIVLLSGRPPLFRPAKVTKRIERRPISVQRTRLYWKFVLNNQQHWVNRAFATEVQAIADAPLEGAKRSSRSTPSKNESRSAKPTIESKRITPKGSRNRKPRKYR